MRDYLQRRDYLLPGSHQRRTDYLAARGGDSVTRAVVDADGTKWLEREIGGGVVECVRADSGGGPSLYRIGGPVRLVERGRRNRRDS